MKNLSVPIVVGWERERCLAGGTPGEPYRITLEREGRARQVKGKETVVFRRGDLFILESCGGGGVGPPEERPPALVESDRADEYA